MRSAPRVTLLALTLPFLACVRTPVAPVAGESAGSGIGPSQPGSAPTLVYKISPSRLLPEVSSQHGLVATEDGARRMLIDRMRLLVRADGTVDRAPELMPLGNVVSVALPSRLGGGFLFYVAQGRGTDLWRATGWLDKLTPLAHLPEGVTDAVPGFDRVYVRFSAGNRVTAIDAMTGRAMPLGPLPSASSYGLFAFADGWRAVVDTDMRGPLATFDAGATWRPVRVGERVQAIGVLDGNPTVMVAGGRYVVDARGAVTFRADSTDPSEDVLRSEGDEAADTRASGPLGKRPLRAAAEDGWPDSPTTALVARGGTLARVSLTDGRVLAQAEDAYPERRSKCHATRLGLHDVGFVCGEPDGPSTVYAWAPPLAMTPVLRFETPRTIAASGNGALVIHGRCGDAARASKLIGADGRDGKRSLEAPAADDPEGHWYCVRTPAGDLREVRVKGFDLGVERVVGLGDGRIAVIVPPRGGAAGSLSVITGSTSTSVGLVLPADARGRDAKHGLWLDGFEERRPGVLGGWVEAGGPVVGIEVALDGKVTVGERRDDAGAIFGGRFAVALIEGGRAMETTDGGMSWAAFDLPDRDEEARAAPSRGCGPVGCALPGWVRIGWGAPRDVDDLKEARAPASTDSPLRTSPTLTLACSVTSTSTPPLPAAPAAPAPHVTYAAHRGPGGTPLPILASKPRGPTHDTGWTAFRNVDAPHMGPDDYGVDNGPGPNDSIGLHAYAWGKAGADWTRGGRWMVRFDDRFDPSGGVRATAVTASLWSQQTEAVEGIGTHPFSGTTWRGFLDPSGRSLLASACYRQACAIYAMSEGQPILPLRSQSGAPLLRPYDGGAVRVGESWYFLAGTPSYDGIALWKGELGAVRNLATYHRTARGYGTYIQPRLVRRALGQSIGVLIEGPREPGEQSGSGLWFILPIDPETGTLGDAIPLIRRDFAGISLSRCATNQDGWALDLLPGTDLNTNVEVDNARGRFDNVELRVRIDPGRACVESLASKTDLYALPTGSTPGPQKALTAVPARKGGDDAASVPMAATERTTGRRWGMRCSLKR